MTDSLSSASRCTCPVPTDPTLDWEITELRKDKARLDWLNTHGTSSEPMRSVRYDGTRQWRYMGVWYDNLRDAVDVARDSHV